MVDTPQEQKSMEAVVERVRKLLALAQRNSSPAEAASAAKKAQQLLTAYNLDMAVLEQGGGGGAREDSRVRGGMYVYERDLWRHVAELNFCFYFTTRERQVTPRRTWWQFRHRVVGRRVNTAAVQAMGGYLQQEIERLCRVRFPLNSQFFCTEAVAFREGAADAVCQRLRERRRGNEMRAERDAAARAKAAGGDTRFALTVADVRRTEEAANYDFVHGDGAWARKLEAQERRKKEWAAEQMRQAEADREAEEAYTRWAAANPDEAAAEERKREKEARRAAERRQSSRYYDDGAEKGRAVSLEQQVDRSSQRRLT